jgi:hypothetical protein
MGIPRSVDERVLPANKMASHRTKTDGVASTPSVFFLGKLAYQQLFAPPDQLMDAYRILENYRPSLGLSIPQNLAYPRQPGRVSLIG